MTDQRFPVPGSLAPGGWTVRPTPSALDVPDPRWTRASEGQLAADRTARGVSPPMPAASHAEPDGPGRSAQMVPGVFEPAAPLTRFGLREPETVADGPSTMDAVTILACERAGGGAPGERGRRSDGSPESRPVAGWLGGVRRLLVARFGLSPR